jgi:hypothetical protein
MATVAGRKASQSEAITYPYYVLRYLSPLEAADGIGLNNPDLAIDRAHRERHMRIRPPDVRDLTFDLGDLTRVEVFRKGVVSGCDQRQEQRDSQKAQPACCLVRSEHVHCGAAFNLIVIVFLLDTSRPRLVPLRKMS